MAKTVNLQQPLKGIPVNEMPIAAPATPPPHNGPPLPVGRVVRGGASGPRLSEMERKGLIAAGWREGDPVPADMAKVVEAAQAAAIAQIDPTTMPLPVDPSTPPAALNVQDINSLPKSEQDRIRENLQDALRKNEQATVAAQAPAAMPDVAQKIAQAKRVNVGTLPPPVRPATRTSLDPVPAAGNPKEKQTPVAAEAAATEVHVESAIAPRTHCPHCEWDLSVPAELVPDQAEKLAFLSSVLGDKVYTRVESLLGGKLQLTFRSLAPKELDACFQQAVREQSKGSVLTANDYWEAVNRYRLFLQLQRAEAAGSFDHDLPDGLSEVANPHATQCWSFPEDAEEPLLMIEEYMLRTVLKTETLLRMATQACGRFNKRVAKLEALVDNPDFWKATEEQSS